MTILSMIFKGVPGDEQVYQSDFDGSGWSARVPIPQIVTASHPAWARYYDQTLLAVWHDTSSPSRVQAGRFDGPGLWTWFGAVPGATTDAAPAGAAMAGATDFMVVWKTAGGTGVQGAIFDSLNFAPTFVVPSAQTSHSPSIAFFDNRMHLVWRGVSGDHSVYHATYAGGAWSAPQPIPGVSTTSQPSLATYDGRLVLAFKGGVEDSAIYWSSLASSASAWLAPVRIANFSTGTGPSVLAFFGRLHLVWKGVGDDFSLNMANFDGSFWWPQHQVPAVSSSSTPSIAEFDPAF